MIPVARTARLPRQQPLLCLFWSPCTSCTTQGYLAILQQLLTRPMVLFGARKPKAPLRDTARCSRWGTRGSEHERGQPGPSVRAGACGWWGEDHGFLGQGVRRKALSQRAQTSSPSQAPQKWRKNPPSAPAAVLLMASGYGAVLKEQKIPPTGSPLQVWQ